MSSPSTTPTIDARSDSTMTINVLRGLPTWIPFFITVGTVFCGGAMAYGTLKADIADAKAAPDIQVSLAKIQSDVDILKKQREEGYAQRIKLQEAVDVQGRVLARIAGKLGVSE